MMEKHIGRPGSVDAHENYTPYIDLVEGDDYLVRLQTLAKETPEFLKGISFEKWNYSYREGKWTIKEVMIHIIDTERIFNYRALRIARADIMPMREFDQNAYIPFAEASQRSIASIIEEYQTVRASTISLFKNFSDDMLIRMGTAAGKNFTPLAIGFIIAGHEIHHLNIVRDRYLSE